MTLSDQEFLQKVQQTEHSLQSVILETPLSFAPMLSQICRSQIYLKKENLQTTGSFKIRGAFNKVSLLTEEERSRGIIAASAGNHAQGVAFAGSHFGIPATIVMPENTPLTKINGVKSYDATVVLSGNNYDEAYTKALELCQEQKLTFVHPFADDDVITGQGTLGLEVLKSVEQPDAILVPIGGGGLISGVARVIKTVSPKTQVIGVTAKGAPAMKNSFFTREICSTDSVQTIADGIAVRKVHQKTYGYICQYVDRIVEVDDDEIASAILFLLEKQKVSVEGAGAVGAAALLSRKLEFHRDAHVVCLLSGGNIDVNMLSIIIEKGLSKSCRTMKFYITLVDKPGSLMILTELLTGLQANIIHIEYDRVSTNLAYGDANVTIALETKGEEHQQEIKKVLKQEGFKIILMQ